MVDFMAETAAVMFAYTGSRGPVDDIAMPLARYLVANGTTPVHWLWPSMPYASSDPGDHIYQGATSQNFDQKGEKGRGDGIHVIEPDKAADAAHGYILLANMTGDRAMRAAAVAVADTLAAQVRALCNGTHSPWPFRVNAETGTVLEQYTSNVVSMLLVFDGIGHTWAPPHAINLVGGGSLPRLEAYARARTIARDWQEMYPEANGRWTACCEDVPIDTTLTNYNSIQSLFAAQYIIVHREPRWEARARSILSFVEKHLIFTGPSNNTAPGVAGLEWGARCVAEQKLYLLKMGTHTGRYAATVGMLWEALGGTNATLEDIAYRSYSWASYGTQTSGVNLVGPEEKDVWFRAHLGGGILQMAQALIFTPHAAPVADHILLSLPVSAGSSVPSSVSYVSHEPSANSAATRQQIRWTSSSVPSTDRLRLRAAPAAVSAGGQELPKRQRNHSWDERGSAEAEVDTYGWWTYDAATGLAVVMHAAAPDVVITTGV